MTLGLAQPMRLTIGQRRAPLGARLLAQAARLWDSADLAEGDTSWTDRHAGATATLTSCDVFTKTVPAFSVPNTAATYVSTPHRSDHQIGGDWSFVTRVHAGGSWTGKGNRIVWTKESASDPNRWARCFVTDTGQLRLSLFPTGSIASTVNKDATVTLPTAGISATSFVYLAGFVDVDNGASGYDILFFTSADGETWTQLGTTVTTTGVLTMPTVTGSEIELGTRFAGTEPWEGRIASFSLWSGDFRSAGVVKSRWDAADAVDLADPNAGQAGWYDPTTGEKWGVYRLSSASAPLITDRTAVVLNGTSSKITLSAASRTTPATGGTRLILTRFWGTPTTGGVIFDESTATNGWKMTATPGGSDDTFWAGSLAATAASVAQTSTLPAMPEGRLTVLGGSYGPLGSTSWSADSGAGNTTAGNTPTAPGVNPVIGANQAGSAFQRMTIVGIAEWDYQLTAAEMAAVARAWRKSTHLTYLIDTNAGAGGRGYFSRPTTTLSAVAAYPASVLGTDYEIAAPSDNPIRNTVIFTSDAPLALRGVEGATWYARASKVVTGWDSMGSGVYKANPMPSIEAGITSPIVAVTTLTETIGDYVAPYLRLVDQGDTTTPTAGGYGLSGGVLYVHLPADAAAGSHTVEVSAWPNGIAHAGNGTLTIDNADVRFASNNGILCGNTGAASSVIATDCVADANGVGGFTANGLAVLMRIVNGIARMNLNDGFNVHTTDASRMELVDCIGSYNGDEGASPHETSSIQIRGGEFNYNGSGGLGAIDTAHFDIDGGTVMAHNQQTNNAIAEGGLWCQATNTGRLGAVTVTDSAGPNFRLPEGHGVDVVGPITSTGGGSADVGLD